MLGNSFISELEESKQSVKVTKNCSSTSGTQSGWSFNIHWFMNLSN